MSPFCSEPVKGSRGWLGFDVGTGFEPDGTIYANARFTITEGLADRGVTGEGPGPHPRRPFPRRRISFKIYRSVRTLRTARSVK